MSDNKDKKKKCAIKCATCEHYNRISDYCREKDIKHCKQQVHTDFSTCESFLIRENLIHF